MAGREAEAPWVGRALPRKEDAALLTGKGRYADDMPVPAGTLVAHILRSPHAHAIIRNIDAARALSLPGVKAVLTGEDIRKVSDPFLVAVKEPLPQWSLAVERVRFVGEPVALIVASDRYIAEDAAQMVDVDYEPLSAASDCREAVKGGAATAHAALPDNKAAVYKVGYGDVNAAFASAAHVYREDFWQHRGCAQLRCAAFQCQ